MWRAIPDPRLVTKATTTLTAARQGVRFVPEKTGGD